MKFDSGGYLAGKTKNLPPGTTVVVLDIVTASVKWQNGTPIEHRITYPGHHPDRDWLIEMKPCGSWASTASQTALTFFLSSLL